MTVRFLFDQCAKARRRCVVLLLCLWPMVSSGAGATLPQLKTAYLFNIAKFVRWTGDPEVIRLCAATSTPHRDLLAALHARPLDSNRRLEVRFLASGDSRNGCELYFRSSSESSSPISTTSTTGQALTVARSNPVRTLIVADESQDRGEPAAIRFFLQDNKLRFEVDQAALTDAGFQISSKLLRLARTR